MDHGEHAHQYVKDPNGKFHCAALLSLTVQWWCIWNYNHSDCSKWLCVHYMFIYYYYNGMELEYRSLPSTLELRERQLWQWQWQWHNDLVSFFFILYLVDNFKIKLKMSPFSYILTFDKLNNFGSVNLFMPPKGGRTDRHGYSNSTVLFMKILQSFMFILNCLI